MRVQSVVVASALVLSTASCIEDIGACTRGRMPDGRCVVDRADDGRPGDDGSRPGSDDGQGGAEWPGGDSPADDPGPQPAEVEWPNAESVAASDPWLVANHDRISVMRPRVLALNFVNGRTNDEMLDLYGRIIAAMREGTRPHGYSDPNAQPFLQYEVAYSVDLTDHDPSPYWPFRNSSYYPREDPVDGYWGFDYEVLFSDRFAELYDVRDPQDGHPMTLCELSERGLVHEVWIYGDADVPDVGAAEILGVQARWDEQGRRIPGAMNRCAGNGCFDDEDEIPDDCTRTLRIGWVNNTRGVGCYLESTSHGIESIGLSDDVPALTRHFRRFGGFDLDDRFGTPFDSWYACDQAGCLSYPQLDSVTYRIGDRNGTIDGYDPVCGNIHFPPNAREHYDITHGAPVASSCEHFLQRDGPNGTDVVTPVDASAWLGYDSLAPDCTGAWAVYWWQSFPGRDRRAREDDGTPLHNWWPYLFY